MLSVEKEDTISGNRTGSTPAVESFTLRAEREPVYNIEVEGDHCYRVGEQGLLVHNASCPKKQKFTFAKAFNSFTVGASTGQVVYGIKGTVVSANGPHKEIPDPKWWGAFLTANSTSTWAKGHLIGSRFYGPNNAYNLAPMFSSFNTGQYKTCENRVADALEFCPGGCVDLEIIVGYSSGNPIPDWFSFKAIGRGGVDLMIDEYIDHKLTVPVAFDCKR